MNWILIFSLVFMQQANHTDVRTETHQISGFSSEILCQDAADHLKKSYNDVALEQSDDYEAADHDNNAQPKEDMFRLMRPVAVCLRTK